MKKLKLKNREVWQWGELWSYDEKGLAERKWCWHNSVTGKNVKNFWFGLIIKIFTF